MPYFSVIIATYNRAHSIRKAIESILKQSFQDFEIIVVDDASTDNTQEVLSVINDERLICIRNEKNEERCMSRNKGIALSSGKYICFLDSDDYHLSHHLETIHREIQKTNEPAAFFFTNAWNETNEGIRLQRVCPDYEGINPYAYFLHYTVNPQRWAVSREVLLNHLFDPEIVICEDMDTSLRILASNTSIYQIKERTTVYVAAEDSFTVSDPKKAEKELFYLTKIFKRIELKGKLPKYETNRLLSMCHYHLAIKATNEGQNGKTLRHVFTSFRLFPKGYNGNTNKSLFVMFIYAFPVLGVFFKTIKRSFKK